MRLVLLSLVGLFAGPALGSDADELAVFSIEDDATAAGGRQQRLEERLRRVRGLALRSSDEIAAKLTSATSIKSRDTRLQVQDLLASAREPYWNTDLVLAAARVTEAEFLINAMGSTPTADRAEVVVWRIALQHGKGDAAGAEREARSLLAMAPDAMIDLDTFPPSVAELVDRIRASLPESIPVRFRGAPRGTSVWIDGRQAREPWRVAPGNHRLHAAAPGFRSIDLTFDADSEVVLSLGLAVALKPELEEKLRAFIHGGEVSKKDRTDFWELLFRSNSDAFLAVARVEGGVRGRVFSQGHASNASAVFPATSDGEESLTQWAVATLAERKAKTPRGTEVARASRRTFHGGLGVSSRAWQLHGSDGGHFTASGFSGTGPQVSGRLAHRNIVAEAEAGFTTYRLRKESVAAGGGTSVDTHGGSAAAAEVLTGYRIPLGRTASAPCVVVLSGGRFERHESDPLVDSQGDLGLLPSWDRLALEIRARAELPLVLPSRAPVAISVTGSLSPWNAWRMRPSKALGMSSLGEPGFGAGVDADLSLGARWACRLGYEGRLNAANLKGVGTAPVDPPLRNARISEQVHSVYLTFGREL